MRVSSSSTHCKSRRRPHGAGLAPWVPATPHWVRNQCPSQLALRPVVSGEKCASVRRPPSRPAIDLIEAARQQADEVMQAGESRVRDLVDARAEHGAAQASTDSRRTCPRPTVEANRRRRLRTPLLVAVLLVVPARSSSWRRKRHAARVRSSLGPPSTPRAESTMPAPGGPEGRRRLGARSSGQTEIEHRTQADAIAQARAMAEDAGGGQIVVHGLDGQPCEPRSRCSPRYAVSLHTAPFEDQFEIACA